MARWARAAMSRVTFPSTCSEAIAPNRRRLPSSSPPAISERGRQLAEVPPGPRLVPYPRAFWIGVPPVDVFPLALWRRLVARRQRCLSPAALHHGPAAGYGPLRDAIAAHLAATRGMRCTGDQVLVFSSAQEALELACRSLLDPGDSAWLENPAWSGARGALIAAGARIVPVAVDSAGIDVARGESAAPEARLAYVTPSHQFPLGVTQSLERRMALLGWASRAGAWILEDDYDSEFRYTGRPLTALHALDASARVLYIGTFNKTIFPALRLAYMVLPPSLVDPILAARRIGGQHSPAFAQHVVADFLAERTLCQAPSPLAGRVSRAAGRARRRGGAGRAGRVHARSCRRRSSYHRMASAWRRRRAGEPGGGASRRGGGADCRGATSAPLPGPAWFSVMRESRRRRSGRPWSGSRRRCGRAPTDPIDSNLWQR